MSEALAHDPKRSASGESAERNSEPPIRPRYLVGSAAAVAAILMVLIQIQSQTEAAAANIANLLPIGFAFAAGIVASVNPCGFLLLPTYISYQMGNEEAGFYQSPLSNRLFRALQLGLVATLGFVVISGIVGVVIAAGGQWLIRVFPYAGLMIGGAMIALGIWLLVSHANLGIMAASRLTIKPQRNTRNVFLFGTVYAAGSLSCTLPIFLVVIGSSFASQGFLDSFGQFISYALGMGLILILVMVGTAVFRGAVLQRLKQAVPYVHSASSMFLIGAGAYLLYYWIFFADAIL